MFYSAIFSFICLCFNGIFNRPRFKDQDYKRKMLLYIEEDRIYVFNIHTYTYICNNVVYNNIFSSFYLYLFLFQFLQFKFSFYQVANELR